MAKRKTASRRNKQDRYLVYMLAFVVLFILVVVSVRSMEIHSKLDSYQARKEQLEAELASQEAYAEELEQLEKTVKTKGYAEEVARDQLGLVYEDEVQFVEQK